MRESIINKKNRILEKIDLPKDVVMDLPKITIIGDNEITIENHEGIESFEDECIKIKTNNGILTIEGQNFEILYIASETIVLSGKFKSVDYGEFMR